MAAAGLGVYLSSREVGERLHRLAADETVQKNVTEMQQQALTATTNTHRRINEQAGEGTSHPVHVSTELI